MHENPECSAILRRRPSEERIAARSARRCEHRQVERRSRRWFIAGNPIDKDSQPWRHRCRRTTYCWTIRCSCNAALPTPSAPIRPSCRRCAGKLDRQWCARQPQACEERAAYRSVIVIARGREWAAACRTQGRSTLRRARLPCALFLRGAAGPGKTEALLMSALQYVDHPHYRALLLRRTFRQLNQSNSIMLLR